jgi:hypothetical protein
MVRCPASCTTHLFKCQHTGVPRVRGVPSEIRNRKLPIGLPCTLTFEVMTSTLSSGPDLWSNLIPKLEDRWWDFGEMAEWWSGTFVELWFDFWSFDDVCDVKQLAGTKYPSNWKQKKGTEISLFAENLRRLLSEENEAGELLLEFEEWCTSLSASPEPERVSASSRFIERHANTSSTCMYQVFMEYQLMQSAYPIEIESTIHLVGHSRALVTKHRENFASAYCERSDSDASSHFLAKSFELLHG